MGTDDGATTLVLPDGTEITVREGDGVPYDLCECEIAGAVAQAVPPDTGDPGRMDASVMLAVVLAAVAVAAAVRRVCNGHNG